MLFRNLLSVKDDRMIDIVISGENISKVCPSINDNDEAEIVFENAIVFPGLINSHDHLDFNNFPRLANKTYNNYTEWGRDIHLNNKAEINEVLAIPKHLRVQYGIYKNLLNGITTVVNHGEKIDVKNEIIRVFQKFKVLHSPRFEKWWKFKLNDPFAKHFLYNMHMGEGTDENALNEINEVIKWNLLKRKIIAVHGIAMTEKQAEKFKALVWCPGSNFALNGKTAQINKLKNKTTILFGTDSTISADWNIWNHLKLALETKFANEIELFEMLTTNAAKAWNINDTAKIAAGYKADLVIAKEKIKGTGLKSFYNIQPQDILLVISRGKIILFDSILKEKLSGLEPGEFKPIMINSAVKYIFGDITGLANEIKSYYPKANFPFTSLI